MKSSIVSLALLVWLTFLCCSIAGSQQAGLQPYNSKTLTEIYGTIESVSIMENPTIKQNGLHLTVKDIAAQAYFVHVCPQWYAQINPDKFNFKKNELVTVIGSRFATGRTRNNMYAATIIRYAPTFSKIELRDPATGAILWNHKPTKLMEMIMQNRNKIFMELFPAMQKKKFGDLIRK